MFEIPSSGFGGKRHNSVDSQRVPLVKQPRRICGWGFIGGDIANRAGGPRRFCLISGNRFGDCPASGLLVVGCGALVGDRACCGADFVTAEPSQSSQLGQRPQHSHDSSHVALEQHHLDQVTSHAAERLDMLTYVLLQIGEYFECFDGVGDLIGAVAE